MYRHWLIILLVLISPGVSFGQNQNVKEQAISTDTIKRKNVSMMLVPIVFYSPETNFAFGVGGQMFFNTKKNSARTLNSNMLISAIYTTNKQLVIEAQPQIYFVDENYYLDAKLRYKEFPNSFWGIGPNTPASAEEAYNQTEISVTAAFLKRLPSNVNFGFEFNFADYNVTEVAEGGILASGSVEGSTGATLVGLGVVLNVDSRDNKFSPLGGGFYQFKTNFTSRVMGSTHSFNTYHLDLRKYVKLGGKHILAMQVYSRLTFGKSPFQAKSHYGGADVARGYFKGRYIDDLLYVVQMEYRMPILKRFELAAFILTGNVGHDGEGQNIFSDFKSSFGFGPRFFLYKDKRTLLRLDFGFNNEGGSGIYFGINEAF